MPFCIDTSLPNAAQFYRSSPDFKLSANGSLNVLPAYSNNKLYGTVTIPGDASSVTLIVTPIVPVGQQRGRLGPGSDPHPGPVAARIDVPTSGPLGPAQQTATVTILNGNGATPLVDPNADTTSTGQSPQTVGDWLVSAGVQNGSVQAVPTIGTSDFSPVYVGDDGIYPIVAYNVQMPANVGSRRTAGHVVFCGPVAGHGKLQSGQR